jgi:hypothetical protein
VSRLGAQAPAFHAVEPPELNLSDAPTIVGKAAALGWYHNVLGVKAVKMSRITERTNSRELPSFIVSGQIAYSTRDLFHDLMSARRSAS